jgi:hypothetical protein
MSRGGAEERRWRVTVVGTVPAAMVMVVLPTPLAIGGLTKTPVVQTLAKILPGVRIQVLAKMLMQAL